MRRILKKISSNQSGQTMTEYALILAVVAVAVIAIMTTMGDTIGETFQSVIDSFGSDSSS